MGDSNLAFEKEQLIDGQDDERKSVRSSMGGRTMSTTTFDLDEFDEDYEARKGIRGVFNKVFKKKGDQQEWLIDMELIFWSSNINFINNIKIIHFIFEK